MAMAESSDLTESSDLAESPDPAALSELTGTVGPEGRLLIPAEFRRRLGLEGGDKVRLVLTEDGLRIITARAMRHALWVNNHGGDAGDAGDQVRAARSADQAAEAAKWARIDAATGDVDLMAELGLA